MAPGGRDEPAKGLAPATSSDLANAFERLRAQQVSIQLVEQGFNFCLASPRP